MSPVSWLKGDDWRALCPLIKGLYSVNFWCTFLLVSVSDYILAQLFSGFTVQVCCACRVPFLMKVDFVLWRQLIMPHGL